MKQLCRFRQSVDINTTIFNYTVAGQWHYRYLEESIIEIRKKDSIDEITSFKKACALANERWPYVTVGTKLFSSKRFLRIWWKNDFRYNDIYEHEFINAVSRSEYEIVDLADFDIVTLANYLPADEFITLLSDKECLSDA